MAKPVLEQLRSMTTVVSDTGDFNAIKEFKPQDATTNPSLIATAAQMPEYSDIVDGTLKDARTQLGESADEKKVANLAFKQLAVEFGKRILQIVPGRVSTEVDARLSYDKEKSIDHGARDHRRLREGRHQPRARPHQDRLHLGRHSGRRAAWRRKASTAT